MALYFAVGGSTGAELAANLKGMLDTYYSRFILMTWPPYMYQGFASYVDYGNEGLGWASIPNGAFVLSGTELVYTPPGGLSITIYNPGRVNWFVLEVPRDSRNVIYWPGSGEQLVYFQQYVVTSIRIPLAIP